jgi:hypothetical protein
MNTLDGSLELHDRVVLEGTIGLEEAFVLNNAVVPEVVSELEDASVLEGAMELEDATTREVAAIPDDIALLDETTTLDIISELEGPYCEDEDCADDVREGG